MTASFTAACVQMRSGLDTNRNVADAERLIREAHARGAQFIATPEMTSLFEGEGEALLAKAKPQDEDKALAHFQHLAEELAAWLLIGSMPIKLSATHCANRSFLLNPQGHIAATYDKMHMFDVSVGDGQLYRESSRFRAGERAVVAQLPWCKLGLTICYDLRFAYLYRHLAQAGAGVLTIPSAFTKTTGEAHWHVLLRARAIETGCFVIAPAQCGSHENNRQTYGHSLIADPWGRILAEAGTEPGIILAEISIAAVAEARGKIPALTHDRLIVAP
jgi:predicted amidohydrolase